MHNEVTGLDAEEHARGDVGLRLQVKPALVVVRAGEPEHGGDEGVAVEVHRVGAPLAGDVPAHEDVRDRAEPAAVALAYVGQDAVLDDALQDRPHPRVGPLPVTEGVVLERRGLVHRVRLDLVGFALLAVRQDFLDVLPGGEAGDPVEAARRGPERLLDLPHLLHAAPLLDLEVPLGGELVLLRRRGPVVAGRQLLALSLPRGGRGRLRLRPAARARAGDCAALGRRRIHAAACPQEEPFGEAAALAVGLPLLLPVPPASGRACVLFSSSLAVVHGTGSSVVPLRGGRGQSARGQHPCLLRAAGLRGLAPRGGASPRVIYAGILVRARPAQRREPGHEVEVETPRRDESPELGVHDFLHAVAACSSAYHKLDLWAVPPSGHRPCGPRAG
mmetsp:Transcript_23221/g.64928  ORF Transcript_23221/g.64928 Transcript_23221/m.64928 type:complete len:389 (-) Transcript_23221:33-1199(-)